MSQLNDPEPVVATAGLLPGWNRMELSMWLQLNDHCTLWTLRRALLDKGYNQTAVAAAFAQYVIDTVSGDRGDYDPT